MIEPRSIMGSIRMGRKRVVFLAYIVLLQCVIYYSSMPENEAVAESGSYSFCEWPEEEPGWNAAPFVLELQQMDRYLWIRKEFAEHHNNNQLQLAAFMTKHLPDYRVGDLRVFRRPGQPPTILIPIAELEKVKDAGRLLGGASISVDVKGDTFQYRCAVKDHFNASYTAICPLHVIECIHISIKLRLVRYAAYWKYQPCPLKRLIWRHTICPSSASRQGNSSLPRQCTVASASHTRPRSSLLWPNVTYSRRLPRNLMRSDIYWRYHNNTALVMVNNRAIPNHQVSSRWKQCVSGFERMFMMGDSHTRNHYHFIWANLGGTFKHNMTRLQKQAEKKLTLFFTGYISELLSGIRNASEELKLLHKQTEGGLSKRFVVYFTDGNWDLAYRGLHAYLNVIPQLIEALKQVKNDPVLRRARWIFSTLPPFVEETRMEQRCRGGDIFNVNCFATAAAMGFIGRELEKHQLLDFVEVFDYFRILLPRKEETPAKDNLHYVTSFQKHHVNISMSKMKGQMGMQALDALLHLLCPQSKPAKL